MTSTGKALQLAQQLARSQPIRVVASSSSSAATAAAQPQTAAAVQYEIPEALKDVPPHLFKVVPIEKMIKQRPFLEFPEWCVAPTEHHPNCHFEVTKPEPNPQHPESFFETKLAPVLLNRFPFYLIGNSNSVCDMTMIHPSISRVHLAVVHHQKGAVCICDINSSNGVFLNGRRIAPAGSYVPINEGDKIRLGASSRTLILRLDKSESFGDNTKNILVQEQQQQQFQHQEVDQNQQAMAASLLVAAHQPHHQQQKENVSGQRRDRAEGEHQVNHQENPPPWQQKQDQQQSQQQQQQHQVAISESTKQKQLKKVFSKVHIAHLLILHKAVEKPVSKAPRNKGEAITRSLEDAIELASAIRAQLATEPDNGKIIDDEKTNRFVFHSKDVFDQAVKEFSECGTAKRNGDMGVIEQGSLPNLPDFEATALKLEVLEMSDVVVTHLGVHILFRVPDQEVDI